MRATAKLRWKSINSMLFAALVLLAMPMGAVEALAQTILTFDAPGADTTVGSQNGTFASGVNNWGIITGSYVDANDVIHGFLRNPQGKFTTFEAPGADTTPGSFNGTTPNSINDLGATTGWYTDTNGLGHGFLRSSEGKFIRFDAPGAGGYGTFPIALNLEGEIAGYYTDSNYSFHAFVRSPDGKFKTFVGPNECTGNGSAGCYGTGASNANAFGIVAGGFEDNSGSFVHHSFVLNADGKLNTFDVPGAGTGSYQGTGCPGCDLGLNQFGAVAGIYSDTNSVNHGFIRSPEGKLTKFDAPGAGTDAYEGTGCFSDCPVSLNDWGAITGVYIDANFVYHGYLRSPAGKFASVDPTGSAGTIPYGINDSGWITGYYIDTNDVYHSFLRIADR